MSVKFVRSSDNKYVQYRLAAPNWSTDIHDWTSEDPYFIDKIMQEVNEAIDENTPIEIHGDVSNAPDEEDLTSVNIGGTDVLKFKDKAYNSLTYSGMGRKILRKNIVEGVNTLTQEKMSDANTIYVIQYDFDLGGETVTIPENCALEFDGGSLSNGSILALSKVIVKGYGNKADIVGNVDNFYFTESYKVSSSEGNDELADGSEKHPFKHINECIKHTNKIALKRGDVFSLEESMYAYAMETPSVVVLIHNTEISAYGNGLNPLLSGFCSISGTYTSPTRPNYPTGKLVMTALTDLNGFVYTVESGTDSNVINNVGYIYDRDSYNFRKRVFDENTPYGWLNRTEDSDLYSWDMSILYDSTSAFYDNVCSAGLIGIETRGYNLTIKNVDFDSLGRHGIAGNGGTIFVSNCNFSNIGGSLMKYSRVAYGNAIQLYITSKTGKIQVEDSTFVNIYDAGVTIQGEYVTTRRNELYVRRCTFIGVPFAIELFNNITSPSYNVNDVGEITSCRFINCAQSKNKFGDTYSFMYSGNIYKRYWGGAVMSWNSEYKRIHFEGNTIIDSPVYCGNVTCRILKNIAFYSNNKETVISKFYNDKTEEQATMTAKLDVDGKEACENKLNQKGNLNKISVSVENSINTVDFSTLGSIQKSVGISYFNTDLQKPMWWNGSDWIDSNGVPVHYWLFGYTITPTVNVDHLSDLRSAYYVHKSGVLKVKKIRVYCSSTTYGNKLKIVKGSPLKEAGETSQAFSEIDLAEINITNGIGWYEYEFETEVILYEEESIGIKANRTGYESTDQLAGFGQYSTTTLPGTDLVELTDGVYLNKHFTTTNALDLYVKLE